MFKLCLLDLDDTLVRTGDLENIRLAGKQTDTPEYRDQLATKYLARNNREIYNQHLLKVMRKTFKKTKFGIFTRSPRSYAETILSLSYPKFKWDVVVAYEDVKKTKPNGMGIHKAMDSVGLEDFNLVLMVGDQDSDIRAAYNAGVAVVLDKTTWPSSRTSDNWNSIKHIPDAIIDHPRKLIPVIENLPKHQPDLERLLIGEKSSIKPRRYDQVGKFIPGDRTYYPVFACGRSFARYKSISERKNWHGLTKSIHDNKNSVEFPAEWIQSVYGFINQRFGIKEYGRDLVITVIPRRPKRQPRLECFLSQLEQYLKAKPIQYSPKITFEPELLAYREGVRSQHQDFLNAKERFQNVRDNLYVKNPTLVDKGQLVLVIDDVCTTGASLIYAGKHLRKEGASEVVRLAISMNIGDVLYG